MALCRQIINLIGFHIVHHLHDGHRVAQVGVMEMEMGFAFEVGYPFTEVHRATTDDAVHLIAFFKKELSKERAVLARNAGY